jgi:FAD/FMN-containing dehydrogenase
MRITRRRVLGGVGVAVSGALLARPAAHLALSALHDRSSLPPPRPGFAEDASRLEAVPVEAHALPAEGAEETLRNLVARATSEGRAIAIAGARHTMGGHTFLPNALAVDMGALRSLRLDEERNLLTAGAGALWSDVIPFLDARGRSVAVMQGYSSFSVGGSLGANAHGWQHDRPPLASTVESFRILVADGRVLRASRSENAELFGMVLAAMACSASCWTSSCGSSPTRSIRRNVGPCLRTVTSTRSSGTSAMIRRSPWRTAGCPRAGSAS